jgi:hypothetical protein
MSLYKNSCLMVAAILLGFSLGGCGKKDGEGPAERAGKEVDKAIDKAGQAMDKAADTVKEAAKDAEKAVTATKDK